MNKQSYKLILNALAFQVLWVASVQGNNWLALLVLTPNLILHYLINHPTRLEWQAILAFSTIGFIGDTVITFLLNFSYSAQLGLLAPIWLLVLWIGFSTTLNHSLKWIFTNYTRILFVTLIAIPASYMAGIQLSGTQTGPLSLWPILLLESLWWTCLLVGFNLYQEKFEVNHG